MMCLNCSSDMYLDDVDFTSPKYKDNYWYCEHCGAFCKEKIRPNFIHPIELWDYTCCSIPSIDEIFGS